jgi:hypothetical protein
MGLGKATSPAVVPSLWDKVTSSPKYECYISKNQPRPISRAAKALIDECDSIILKKDRDDIFIILRKMK